MPLTKVTSGVIAANAVVDSFGTQSITGDKIGLTAINANNIVTGAVTGDKLGATSINANNIVTGAVTGDKIGATAINANNIVNGTITTTQIASNTISNTNIATGAIENYSRATGILSGMRNRIINGAMVIDQRNAGASVNVASAAYCVDRWRSFEETDGTATIQQVSDAPSGFSYSLKWTTTTADGSLSAGQFAGVDQKIEGFNTADLAFGTASAKTVTLSFWVKSSLTGTFGGALANEAFNRSYPFTYTISSANTWEQKSVTIAGDTSGTWVGATNGTGLFVQFGLGVGSTYSGTAGAWASAGSVSATGATSVIGTLNATWFLTGVQLEVGSTATSFDYRPYGTELQLCQRYFARISNGTLGAAEINSGWYYNNTHISFFLDAPVPMRTGPTLIATTGADYYIIYRNNSSDTFTTFSPETSNGPLFTKLSCYNNSEVSGTAGQAGIVRIYNASASIALSAEL